MKYEKSCGAIVLRRDKTDKEKLFLLVIRQYKGGPASFPKGHMERGETEIETAEREVLEETAVRISISEDFREIIRYSPARGVEKDVVYFLAFTENSAISPRRGEIAEAFWVEASRANDVLEHENDRQLFRKALGYIREKNTLVKL